MEKPNRLSRRARVAIAVATVGALLLAGKLTGVLDRVDLVAIRDLVRGAGVWGVPLYLATFALGLLVYVPGMLFVVAAILVWGDVAGAAIGHLGAVIASTTSFLFIRSAGGSYLAEMQRPIVRRILAKLDAWPILTIAVLRSFFALSPMITHALALTSVRPRDYIVGTAVGMIPPVLVAALLTDWVRRTFLS